VTVIDIRCERSHTMRRSTRCRHGARSWGAGRRWALA
jgi:hypothetical protein